MNHVTNNGAHRDTYQTEFMMGQSISNESYLTSGTTMNKA